MNDQYGNAVPADLVTLPSYCLMDEAERAAVLAADWYEANGILLYADDAGIGGDSPLDAGLRMDADGNLEGCSVLAVDDCLKRGNDEDGWYHA